MNTSVWNQILGYLHRVLSFKKKRRIISPIYTSRLSFVFHFNPPQKIVSYEYEVNQDQHKSKWHILKNTGHKSFMPKRKDWRITLDDSDLTKILKEKSAISSVEELKEKYDAYQ